MSAMIERINFAGWGDVPEEEQAPSNTMRNIDAWVYSYATPIAWRYTNGDWYMPPVRYSVTTSGHQFRTAERIGYDFEVETSLMVGNGHNGRYGARKGGW